MTKLNITGIDPGISGAIVTVQFDNDMPVDFSVVDIPIIGVGKDSEIDSGRLSAELRDIKLRGCHHVFMERLHAMPPPQKGRPGRGTVAAWKLAKVVGHLEQAISDHDLPLTLVTPQQWKNALKVASEKEGGRMRALQLFPMARKYLYRVKDHNRAEALLIAEWGRRYLGGAYD